MYRGYPTEKPVPLLEVLILQSSGVGETVVDPFFGSGSTLIAAHNLGRKFQGCDISDNAHEHYEKRKLSGVVPKKTNKSLKSDC